MVAVAFLLNERGRTYVSVVGGLPAVSGTCLVSRFISPTLFPSEPLLTSISHCFCPTVSIKADSLRDAVPTN